MDVHPTKNGINRDWFIAISWISKRKWGASFSGWQDMTSQCHKHKINHPQVITDDYYDYMRDAQPSHKMLVLTFDIFAHMGMDQYLLIPFLGGWTSINPSYFDVNYRGTRFWHTATWVCWKKGDVKSQFVLEIHPSWLLGGFTRLTRPL